MTDKKIYELLKKNHGAIAMVKTRSGLSYISIRRIMRDGEWVNLNLREHAISVLEELKSRQQQKAKKEKQLESRLAQLVC